MVEEGVDVGIRIAQSLDGRYVARALARARLSVYASKEYLSTAVRSIRRTVRLIETSCSPNPSCSTISWSCGRGAVLS